MNSSLSGIAAIGHFRRAASDPKLLEIGWLPYDLAEFKKGLALIERVREIEEEGSGEDLLPSLRILLDMVLYVSEESKRINRELVLRAFTEKDENSVIEAIADVGILVLSKLKRLYEDAVNRHVQWVSWGRPD